MCESLYSNVFPKILEADILKIGLSQISQPQASGVTPSPSIEQEQYGGRQQWVNPGP